MIKSKVLEWTSNIAEYNGGSHMTRGDIHMMQKTLEKFLV